MRAAADANVPTEAPGTVEGNRGAKTGPKIAHRAPLEVAVAVVDDVDALIGLPREAVLPAATLAVARPAAVRPARPEELARVATSLLDIRTCLEGDLRTLTSMQRSLERVRSHDAISAEAELLLGEMARQLGSLQETCAGLEHRLRSAGYELEAVRGR